MPSASSFPPLHRLLCSSLPPCISLCRLLCVLSELKKPNRYSDGNEAVLQAVAHASRGFKTPYETIKGVQPSILKLHRFYTKEGAPLERATDEDGYHIDLHFHHNNKRSKANRNSKHEELAPYHDGGNEDTYTSEQHCYVQTGRIGG